MEESTNPAELYVLIRNEASVFVETGLFKPVIVRTTESNAENWVLNAP